MVVPTVVVSKREFVGNWEYLLDQAIFTSPPATNWSGAALVSRDLKLVGVGSLIVREATADDSKLPGNVFVPIDLLKPILADLIREGAIVLICQPCLAEFGLKLDNIVPGVQVSRPGYLENFVFADNVRTLTW